MRIDRALSILSCALLGACSSTDAPPVSTASADDQEVAPGLSDVELAARIERGRALLDAGQAVEAEAVFAEASAADGQSLRTRMWVLRAWMDQGRSNETLDALDELERELERAGARGLEMTYLYGMAFARRAEGYLADGVTDSSVQMNFLDAADFLAQAVEADAELYRDAFLPLARSAWYVGQIDAARRAADRAVEVYPDTPEGWLVRGRIAMAQFIAAEGEEPGSASAEALWSEAADSFRNAVERSGTPVQEDARARLAEAATQLGHALVWRQKGPEATDAYATAIAWDPQGFDYAQALEFLSRAPKSPEDDRPTGFRAALELARTRFEAHAAVDDPRTATLCWWLGWARFVDADWDGSEEAFQQALARAPDFANSWFYIGIARQYRKDHEGALVAMHAGWEGDPVAMVTTTASAGGALRAFEDLLGWCASQEPARNLDAAFLAEMLAEAMPDEARFWNNVGLFLRDEGERLEDDARENETEKPDPALLDDLYSRSYSAYLRALELQPDDPQLICDTAVMVTYHIGGDLVEVEAMYLRALELAEARLAASDLSAEDRARFEQTRDDIGVNLKALQEHAAEEAKKEAAEAEEEGEGAEDTTASDSDESPRE